MNEEIIDWRVDLYNVAQQRMYDCRLWGNRFSANCLPVSLAVLVDAREHYPDAKVVIGLLLQSGEQASENAIKAIESFPRSQTTSRPDFHAWIDLDGTEVLDFVGPSWVQLSLPFFDRQLANQHGLTYFPVLQSRESVADFYHRLKELQPRQ